MKVKVVTSKDFNDIAKENEYFFVHFVNDDITNLEIFSYNKKPRFDILHPMKDIIDSMDIPYYEMDVRKEYDFVINLADGFSKFIQGSRKGLSPLFTGFNKRRLVASTWQGGCYCPEGIIEVIGKTNPSFLLNLD